MNCRPVQALHSSIYLRRKKNPASFSEVFRSPCTHPISQHHREEANVSCHSRPQSASQEFFISVHSEPYHSPFNQARISERILSVFTLPLLICEVLFIQPLQSLTSHPVSYTSMA